MSSSRSVSWCQQDRRRILYFSIRAENLEHCHQYYEQHLGMKLWRRMGSLEQDHITMVCGFGSQKHSVNVHIHNDEARSVVNHGRAFGHFSCSYPGLRIARLIEDMELTGGGTVLKVEEYEARDVESLRLGRDADKLAVVVDPAGYCWEVLERHERQVTEPLCKVMLRVAGDLESHIRFYNEVLGMNLIRKASLGPNQHECAYMSYKPCERDSTWIELLSADPAKVDDKGDAFQYTALATRDVLKTAEAIKQAGAPIVHDVGYMPGTEITWVVTQDPSGWKFAFISESDYFKDIKQRQQVA